MPPLYLISEVHFRLYVLHLEKSIWRHNSVADRPITTKYGRQMKNDMPMTIHTSQSKPEVEFQYGGRPFSETGSSFMSAVDWDISSKFGRQIDFHLLKQVPSLYLNPEVHFRLYGRHLENSIWRHNSGTDFLITTKFGREMYNDMAMTIHSSNGNRKQNSNMAAVLFPKPEVVLFQPWIEISHLNLSWK